MLGSGACLECSVAAEVGEYASDAFGWAEDACCDLAVGGEFSEVSVG